MNRKSFRFEPSGIRISNWKKWPKDRNRTVKKVLAVHINEFDDNVVEINLNDDNGSDLQILITKQCLDEIVKTMRRAK